MERDQAVLEKSRFQKVEKQAFSIPFLILTL